MEKRKKREYLGARVNRVLTMQGYGSEIKPEPTMVDDQGRLVYKSPSPNETDAENVLFGRGCSAEGCALIIPLDSSLHDALNIFSRHNEINHNERYLQHMIYLYRKRPTDPDLGTEGEGVVK